MKQCRQCGVTKEDSEFRAYYRANTRSTYTICKECERINSRYKYLRSKKNRGAATQKDLDDFASIEQLYNMQRSLGLRPPAQRTTESDTSISTNVSNLMDMYKEKLVDTNTDNAQPEDVPAELQEWLTKDISAAAPQQLRDVYLQLCDKFMPTIGLNKQGKPVFDQTYSTVLNKILCRFKEREDE